MNSYIDREQNFGAHNYNPLRVVLNRGEGVYLWDTEGRRYLDMMSAYSAVSHGHCHPRLVAAISDQAKKLGVSSRAYYNDQLGYLCESLCQLMGYESALLMNSGAEAVETALKLARRFAYQHKKIEPNKAEIIVIEGNFHGRTLGAVSLSTEPSYQKDFGPFLPGFKAVPFGDIEALKKAITPNTCAFLFEPIQGEAGIRIPADGWLKNVRDLCNEHHVLMVADEIQSGLGRSGYLLACEHENVKPDVAILGKSLGGGLLPVSAILASRDLMDLFTPGSHGSTFGGNALAARVAREALAVLIDEDFCVRSQELGSWFLSELRKIKMSYVSDVRGRGLWIGIETDPKYPNAADITARRIEKLKEKGLLTRATRGTVIRLAPPLVISKHQLEEGLSILSEVLCEEL